MPRHLIASDPKWNELNPIINQEIQRGKSIKQIALELNLAPQAIYRYRTRAAEKGTIKIVRKERTQKEYWVPQLTQGNPMEECLTEDQCETMRIFLRSLLSAWDQTKGKLNVGRFILTWRQEAPRIIARGEW